MIKYGLTDPPLITQISQASSELTAPIACQATLTRANLVSPHVAKAMSNPWVVMFLARKSIRINASFDISQSANVTVTDGGRSKLSEN